MSPTNLERLAGIVRTEPVRGSDPAALAEALHLIAHDGLANAALAVEMAEWLDRRLAQSSRRTRRPLDRTPDGAPLALDPSPAMSQACPAAEGEELAPPSGRIVASLLDGLSRSRAVLGTF